MPHVAVLELFQVHAVTAGTDAQAEVSVRLEDEASGKAVTAKGADPDTLVASAKAYVSALNKLKIKQAKGPGVRDQVSGVDLKHDARRGP